MNNITNDHPCATPSIDPNMDMTTTQDTTPSKPPRFRAVMYTQQMAHLPVQTLDDLRVIVVDQLKPKQWAMILHDKDVDEKGQPVAPHVHLMMKFSNPRHLSATAKELGDKPQSLQKWDGRTTNGFMYLLHRTESAKDKYQYDPADAITSGPDSTEFFAKIQAQYNKVSSADDKNHVYYLLDLMGIGQLTKDELIDKLSGSEYAKFHRQIDALWAKRMNDEAAQWRQEMTEAGQAVRVTWLYGSAGTGKTSFARELAERDGREYFIAGSTRDPYQSYKGQHIVILDELRPNSIPEYSDLLRLLDPFGSDVMAPSRYQDKPIMADTIYVTTPYDPVSFYNELMGECPSKYRQIDSLGQLLRRLSLVIHMDNSFITLMEYQEKGQGYAPSAEPPRPNAYSQHARKGPPLDNVAEFNRLFDDPAATNDSGGSTPQTGEDTTPNE